MKKVLTFLIALCLIVSIMPIGIFSITANAASNAATNNTSGTVGQCTWTLDGTVLTISGNGSMGGSDFSSEELPWGNDITEVVVENGVTNIVQYAFYNCKKLAKVTLPDTLKSIDYMAFSDCDSLTSITIPNSVTSIGDSAFFDCDSLTSITIPDSVISIGDSAFYDCDSLTSITIPDSVIIIGDSAFSWCTNLTNIAIPNGVTNIGRRAFYSCESLSAITIPDSVISIGGCAFWRTDFYWDGSNWENGVLYIGNHLIEAKDTISGKYTVKSGVKTIADSAFNDCDSLTSITIPDSVTSIGTSAFENCSSLTSITIPDSVRSIGGSAFFYTAVYNEESNWENGVLYIGNHLIKAEVTISGKYTIKSGTKSIADSAFYDCSSLTGVTIPNGVVTIGDYAFSFCSSLTGVTIPNGVVTIGNDAFSYCSLTSLIIPKSVVSIGDSAFSRNYFETITIPDSVTYIGKYVFSSCTSLQSVTISKSVTYIGGSAFDYCSNLKKITVDADNKYYSAQMNVLFDKEKTTLIKYAPEKTVTAYTVPNTVRTICTSAFRYSRNLKDLTISNGVISIESEAFADSYDLETITIPDSVTYIGKYVFSSCTSLQSVTISKSVTYIGDSAFDYCSNLKKITVDTNNKNYSTLEGVLFNKDKTTLISYPCGKTATTYTLPESVINIEDNAFYQCYKLTSVTLPDTLRTIGDSAFSSCDNLKSVTIPNGVVTIGYSAFSWTGITTLAIPASVKEIKDSAFRYCQSFKEINVDKDNENYSSLNGVLFNKDKTILILYPFAKTATTYNVPNGVETIRSGSFSGNESIKKIFIPTSVKCIEDLSFDGCDALADIWYAGSKESKEKMQISFNYEFPSNIKWHFNTCYNGAKHIFDNGDDIECNTCGYKKCYPHTFEWVIDKAATCKDEGIKHEECTNCHTKQNENTVIYRTDDHSYDNDCDALCNVCGGERYVSHCYEWVIDKDATCFSEGIKHEECYYCGDKRSENTVVPKYEYHDYEWVVDKKATCLEEGIEHEECSFCHTKRNENTIIPISDNHTYDSECDEVCNVCGYERYVWHYYHWVINKEATCAQDGIKHEKCYYCDKKRNENTIIPATGIHIYDYVCDEACNTCGLVRTVEHTYDNKCDTTCNICSITRTIEHTYDNNCDEQCNVCGKTRTVTHNFNKISITNDSFYPFALNDGIYSSTNKSNYSSSAFTITALCDFDLQINYKTSTEYDDKLTIKQNSTTKVTAWGTDTYWETLTLNLSTGDKVYIAYNKDNSYSSGEDTVYFKLNNYCLSEPTCESDVVCYECNRVIKNALGHDYTDSYDTKCNRCGEMRSCESKNGTYEQLSYIIEPTENGGKLSITDCSTSAYGNITVPDKIEGFPVTSIKTKAFENCKMITGIFIPDSVTEMGDAILTGCTGLLELEIPYLDSVFAKLFNEVQYEISDDVVPHSLKKVTVNSGIIPNGAFRQCNSISIVVLGDKVTAIGEYAFYWCNSITRVTVGNDATIIGAYAFQNCVSLTKVTLGSSVDVIENSAFKDCVSLLEIVITNNVTKINDSAFENCKSLGKLTLGKKVEYIGNSAFKDCISLTDVAIPDSTLLIGSSAFEKCSAMTTVTFGKNVTTVFDRAFLDCSKLKRVVLPNSTTSIGEYAFKNCVSIKRAVLRGRTDHINNGVFEGCTSLTVIAFPKNVNTIAYNAFYDCNSLSEVWYEGTKAEYNEIIIAYGNDSIKNASWSYGKFDTVNHTYSNNCDESCNICGDTRTVTHNYSNATCTKAKTCKVCGATSGKALGHTYTNSCDASCNRCGVSRSVSHTYNNVTTKATLTKNGSIIKKCTNCGNISSKTIIYYPKTIKLSATVYTYSGGAKAPAVTVKNYAGNTLKKNTDYTITYAAGRKNVGKYKVTVTFKGKYSGTKNLYFTINPVKTTVSRLTAGKKSLKVAVTKKTTQVTGYQIQYATNKSFKSAKTKNVTSYKTTSVTLKSLSAQKTYYVRVRTYKTVNGVKYYSGWSAYKYAKTK